MFSPETRDVVKGVEPVNLIDEMQRSYLDYAMSVIVSRALPDVRDGLKPVHRRILYAMNQMGLHWNKPYRKSAGVVGEVMGKYHPHGDASIYDALVRLAQNFSLRDPFVDGQGNFGSIDGDSAAAMRYTECRLEKISETFLVDLDKETVDFQPTYDGLVKEPVVLPVRFPNLLVNGSGGIAVGMATNIPPHNLKEVVNACIALIEDPSLSLEEIMEILPGPDFPTGGIILGKKGIRSAYETGRGILFVRAKIQVETTTNDRKAIVVTEIPYQVNKASMIEKIAALVREKRIEGIADLRDESDRDGYRVVLDLKRDVIVDVVLNQLYRYTPLQTSFGCNMVALNGRRPEKMGLLNILHAFISFREEVVSRRTKYLLAKAREHADMLVGLAIAVANIDDVISIIRTASNPTTARDQLMERAWVASDISLLIKLIDDPRHVIRDDSIYSLSEKQARFILDLRLQRLTAVGRYEISDELSLLGKDIAHYLDVLASRSRILSLIKDELIVIRDAFSTERRTCLNEESFDCEDEDFIAREDMVVTLSFRGYIKRVPLSIYRAQRRGGKGRSGMAIRSEDFVKQLCIVSTYQSVLFFSSRGMVYKEKVWRLPIGNPYSYGRAIINIFPLEKGERITSVMALPEDIKSLSSFYIVFLTNRGTVRRNKLGSCIPFNRNGKIAMRLEEKRDEILSVTICKLDDDVLLTTEKGQCIRFPVGDIRVFAGRHSIGVRGISVNKDDRVISLAILSHVNVPLDKRRAYIKHSLAERRALSYGSHTNDIPFSRGLNEECYKELRLREQMLFIVSEFGFGKRVSSYSFRISGRGGKGVKLTDSSQMCKIGKIVAVLPVKSDDQIMLVSKTGQLIRVLVEDIPMSGRITKGVLIFKMASDDKVVSVQPILDMNVEKEEKDCELK
ncbi:MAG: DNA gyrase subunit A [Candidatus Tokpelaia sp. JSC161]|jgi:DNA gyrase subunit A|nr:MAG: DNA gyrase subunit A [Candidatus Tokpelaia sp. JSC161]